MNTSVDMLRTTAILFCFVTQLASSASDTVALEKYTLPSQTQISRIVFKLHDNARVELSKGRFRIDKEQSPIWSAEKRSDLQMVNSILERNNLTAERLFRGFVNLTFQRQ